MDREEISNIAQGAAGKVLKVSDRCFRTVDVWLDITRDFASLQGMIMSGAKEKDFEGPYGDIGLTASYGYGKGIVSQKEVEVAKYHSDQIRKALEGIQPKTTAYKRAQEAIIWAGRSFADNIVGCECGETKAIEEN